MHWFVSVLNGSGGYWDQEGCITNRYQEDEDVVQCSCDHFTNFALLVSPGGQVGETPLEMSLISYIGAVLSLLGMVLTIISHGCIR